MIKREKICNKIIFLILIVVFTFSQILISSEFRNQFQENVHFYFVQITDTHLGQGNQLKWTKKVVEAINELPIKFEFVVHTGDISYDKIHDNKLWRNAEKVFKKINSPLHYLPGNHDILKDNMELTMEFYRNRFGNLSTIKEYHGVVFIFFYDDSLINSFPINEYSPLEWIETALKKADEKPVIIFHHSPPFNLLSETGFQGGWPKDIFKEWEKILNSYNVKAIITGHYHRDSHHWLGNIPIYVSASVAAFPGRPVTFRVYEYVDGKVGYWTQYIEPKKNFLQRLIKKIKK